MKLSYTDNWLGFEELLRDLPRAVQTKAIVSALKAGAEVVKIDARQRVARRSGETASNIKVREVTSRRKTKRVVKVGVIGKQGPVAHLIEYGSTPIRRAKNKMMKFVIDGRTIFARAVKGMPKKPFLRPAMDANINKITTIIENQLGVRIKAEYEKLIRQKIKRAAKRAR